MQVSSEALERRRVALDLLGKLVRFAHEKEGGYLCTLMDGSGMVEIMGVPGRFAPHLFVVVEEGADADPS